jgi:hypothetical protein
MQRHIESALREAGFQNTDVPQGFALLVIPFHQNALTF